MNAAAFKTAFTPLLSLSEVNNPDWVRSAFAREEAFNSTGIVASANTEPSAKAATPINARLFFL